MLPRDRCASPHPPPSLSVSFFSIPLVLKTTIKQFVANPIRPRPTKSDGDGRWHRIRNLERLRFLSPDACRDEQLYAPCIPGGPGASDHPRGHADFLVGCEQRVRPAHLL